jgi:diguanylate cyclase (GGDEF)-like protein
MSTVLRRVAAWLPSGGGLRDEDWHGRHRLLTVLLAVTATAVTVFGLTRPGMAVYTVTTFVLAVACTVGAARLRHRRRLASILTAFGLTTVCAGFVALTGGLTEAHFTFFIAVSALALYRDWAPFGMSLAGTTFHHAVFGTVAAEHTYQHVQGASHPLLWSAIHGAAVLAAAGFQTVAWRLSEIEERRAQDNLDESQAQLEVSFEQTPVPMMLLRPDGRILRMNTAATSWFALSNPIPDGFAVGDLPVTAADGHPPLQVGLTCPGREPVTHKYLRADGTAVWVEVHSTAVRDRAGTVRMIFAHLVDVTGTRRHQEQLRHQVRHDPLTGMLSRAGFDEDLTAMLTRGVGPVSVLYADVDRFKSVNDGSGHSAGDEVLQAVAGRLTAAAPAGALVSRLGGDEFVIAFPAAAQRALRDGLGVLNATRAPLTVAGRPIVATVSMGLATTAGPGTAEALLRAADTAMYAAKNAGGNRLEVFTGRMADAVQAKVDAEARLRWALAGDLDETLPVWFQPVVATATGRICGAEALVRMRDRDGRILAPGHFIGAAEETGLVVDLGEHVLRSAVRYLTQWDLLGYVSVNVSPRQLAEPDFVPMLASLLSAHPDLAPARLILEITETAMLASSVDVTQRLDMIKQLGVGIALDDFGTGYSSLTWLKSVPADVVKLDRSFVSGLATDAKKASIISALLWLAQSLGMSVTAEGVEEPQDWDALCDAQCPTVQGYFFSKPLPAGEFAAMLLAGTTVDDVRSTRAAATRPGT